MRKKSEYSNKCEVKLNKEQERLVKKLQNNKSFAERLVKHETVVAACKEEEAVDKLPNARSTATNKRWDIEVFTKFFKKLLEKIEYKFNGRPNNNSNRFGGIFGKLFFKDGSLRPKKDRPDKFLLETLFEKSMIRADLIIRYFRAGKIKFGSRGSLVLPQNPRSDHTKFFSRLFKRNLV